MLTFAKMAVHIKVIKNNLLGNYLQMQCILFIKRLFKMLSNLGRRSGTYSLNSLKPMFNTS